MSTTSSEGVKQLDFFPERQLKKAHTVSISFKITGWKESSSAFYRVLKTSSILLLEVKISKSSLHNGFYVFPYFGVMTYFITFMACSEKDFFSLGINVAMVHVTSVKLMLHNKININMENMQKMWD